MKYCPKCGTANRDGSRFCNECGEELNTQQVECPRCGTLNPVQNVLCSECGTRLPPAVSPPADTTAAPAIKGLSLPTKNPIGEQDEEPDAGAEPEPDDETPAWLRELGASLSEEGESDDTDASEDAGEVPDWLRDLRASLPEEPEHTTESTEGEEKPPDWLEASEAVYADAATEWAYDGESEPEQEEPESMREAPGFEPQPSEDGAGGEEAGAEDELLGREPGEDEVPGWLSRLVPAASAADAEGESPDRDEEETPAWLARLVPGEGEDETEAEGEAAGWQDELVSGEEETLPRGTEDQDIPPSSADMEEDEVPSWLADLQRAEEEADEVEAAPPDIEIEEGEIPDWMAALQPADEEAEAEAAVPDTEIEEAEVPDWLAGLQPADEDTDAEAEPATPEIEIEEGELPDWVAALRPQEEEAEGEPSLSVTGIEEEELPDRVTELEPPTEEIPLAEALDSLDEAEIEPPEEDSEHKLPDDVEAMLGPAVPAWLAELQVEAPEAAAAIIEETMVDGELPDWLVRSEIEPDEGLAPAEIPAWLLALKPPELREEGEEAEIEPPAIGDKGEETGLLAGITGTLPVEMLIAQPRAVAAAQLPELTIEDSPPARLFADVVGRPPDAAPKEIEMHRADVLPRMARWIIYAILIVAVALPIIIGKPLLVRTIESTAATVDMHTAIEALDSQDPVLVAFDYDPTSSGEMDVIAKALIGNLMDQEARVVVVSLMPAGPATAQSLLDELAAERPAYAESYGERYANLGYLPGEAAAVRLLGLSMQVALPSDFYGTPQSDLPVMQGLDSTQSFSLIVELAATQDTLRWWIEQAGTPYDVPLGAGASAAVIPYARSYYETEPRQLVGIVGGVPDAVTYEALSGDQSGPTSSSAARLDSQLAGQILFVLVLLAGNVIYFSRRGTGRER